MAVYTDVGDEEISTFIASYGLGEVVSFKGIAEGVENTNYLVETDRGWFILTLYEKRVNPAELPFFLALMEHLAGSGLNCPTPVRDNEGRNLREIAGRIFSRRLDRQRPLWEIWVIEGLEKGEQVAILNKIHHCMIDGAAGADLSTILFSPSPQYEEKGPLPYYPRPAPTGIELVSDRLREALAAPREVLRAAQRLELMRRSRRTSVLLVAR